MVKPVYIFSGFLDSGKTRAIKSSLLDPRFNDGDKTLIICFEQGDEEYDEKFLKKTNSEVIYLDSINDLDIATQKKINISYKFDKVFIELNGMEDDNILYNTGFIKNWDIAQTLTTMDASKFNLYLTNMRQFLFNHVVNAEVVILNRADDVDRRYLRNNLKSINQRLEIIYEDKDGNVTNHINDDLFDLSKDLYIEDIDYGLWYMDALDNAMKYDNKIITLKVKHVEDIKEYSNVVIMGRKAMVCCNNDIQDIALTFAGVSQKDIDHDKYYLITGKIHVLDDDNGDKACVIYATSYKEAPAPESELVTFN